MPSLFQLPIQLVQYDIGQCRWDRSTLCSFDRAWRDFVAILDSVRQELEQFRVVNRVEEFRQIQVDYPSIAFFGVF